MLVKVQNEPSYARDSRNKAIINVDNDRLAAYKNARAKRNSHMTQVQKLSNDIDELKGDMVELQNLLAKLLNRL